jgi:chromosome segregation ATPase
MSKYGEYLDYLHNMPETAKELRDRVAELDDQIVLIFNELKTSNAIIEHRKNHMPEDPVERAVVDERIYDLQIRLTDLEEILAVYQKERHACQESLEGCQLESLASEALSEQEAELTKLHGELSTAIEAAEAARQGFLKAISEASRIGGECGSLAGRLKDIALHAKKPRPRLADAVFTFHLHPFVVSLDDLKAARRRN